MVNYTQAAFTAALEEVVAEFGADFVYQRPVDIDGEELSCLYVKDEQPDCLIGKTLFKLGVSLDTLKSADPGSSEMFTINGQEVQNPSARQLLMHLGFDEATANAAGSAQSAQDEGATWGTALNRYRVSVRVGVMI